MSKVARALLSVSDKSGIVELARALAAAGVQIISTGGTAKLLEKEGVKVTEVSALCHPTHQRHLLANVNGTQFTTRVRTFQFSEVI